MDRRTLLGAAALGLVSSAVISQEAFAAGEDGKLMEALMIGALAVKSSELALDRAEHRRVKDFARLEIEEQERYARAVAERPPGLTPAQRNQLDHLQRLSGRAFDEKYIALQLAGHQDLLRLNKEISEAGRRNDNNVALLAVAGIETHIYLLKFIRHEI